MLKYYLLVLFAFLSIFADGRTVIDINDQGAFDLLQRKIDDAINAGELDILIRLQPGKYYFNEKHLTFKGVHQPDLLILFEGKNSIMIPEGVDHQDGEINNGGLSIYRGWTEGKNDIPVWSSLKQTNQIIEIVDKDSKLCRLKSLTPLKDTDGEKQYILITQWYKSNAYIITKIKDNYIYFTASDLSNSDYKKTEYNINDDYNYFSKYPRYKLSNVSEGESGQSIVINNGKLELPTGISVVHECKASTFLYMEDCKVGHFIIENLEFWGSAYGYPDSFFSIKETEAMDIAFRGCSFYCMHNNVISISNTSNVTIENNLFSDVYYTGVQSDNKSKNTKIVNNYFYNAGLGLSNTFCIFCGGLEYYISGNKLINYGYGGIRVGLWYRTPLYNTPSGIVENNSLMYTNDYMDRITIEGLMDGGAIYISTINDKAIIRHNYINGYGGAGGNRGIFCDDGALGYEIYGNIILNIKQKDYCIASRREPSVEKRNDSRSGLVRSNINNIIRDNLLDGKIMFRGHEDVNNGCVKGTNYILLAKGETPPINQIDNIPFFKDDIIVDYEGTKDNKIVLSRKSYRALRKSKEWSVLRRFIQWR